MAHLFTTQTPGLPDVNEAINVTVGITVVFDTAGTVTGAWFYAPATLGAGTYEAAFWVMNTADGTTDAGTGTLLANALFSSITPGAWNFVAFSGGVAVDIIHAYVISLRTSEGRYAATSAFFTSALVNGHITGIQGDTNPVGLGALYNGRFIDNSIVNFPKLTFNHNGYFVDVEFTAGGSAATASPYVVTSVPAARPGQQTLLRNTAALIVPPAKGAAPLIATQPAAVPAPVALIRRSSLADPPVLTTGSPKVVTSPAAPPAASAILIRNPQPPAAIVSGPTTAPIVVTQSRTPPAGAAVVLRSSLQDAPVATPGPIVVTSLTAVQPSLPFVGRGSLADFYAGTKPLVVTGAAAAPIGGVLLARNPQPFIPPVPGPTTEPIVVTAVVAPPRGMAVVARAVVVPDAFVPTGDRPPIRTTTRSDRPLVTSGRNRPLRTDSRGD